MNIVYKDTTEITAMGIGSRICYLLSDVDLDLCLFPFACGRHGILVHERPGDQQDLLY